ncbi:hypothetical protein INR49_016488 [Caranx melampygus]|nr:hypothetical protein INR49_016488 [Caranx melampygus]
MWSVFFVFLSYLDRNFVKADFLDAEKESEQMFSILNGTLCAKMSAVGENFLYQVSDGAEVVRSVVSPSGKLVDCSVIVNQMQVKSFMHECRLGLKEQRAGRQLETRLAQMNEAKVMCRQLTVRSGRSDRLERDDSDDSALQDKVLQRSKRGFTYPGTLWLKDCLRKVNDTSSRVVGQAFFNVIGVPCFEFAYEEQCAERHWYGLCKRYEKFPIAVLQEAVPYDFGGIDVIDVLTVAPPSRKDSKKSEEEEKPESTTQSTMSGPEEPSLTNVVTAAEDFIKVLATVSTSQSSNADSDRDDSQSSEKKNRKNTGKKKKTNKKQKGKGKGRKRKQKAEVGVKAEEGAAVSPSGNKAGEINALSNFISESHKHGETSRSTNRVGDNEYELEGKEELSNEVMKDDPEMGKETVSMTSSVTFHRKPAESDADVLTEVITLSAPTTTTTVIPHKAKSRGLRKGRRKKIKKVPPPPPEELVANTPDDNISVSTISTITPTDQPQQQSYGRDADKSPVVSTAGTPIVILKVKGIRSKERGDREGRKRRKKVALSSPIVSAAPEHSSVDSLKVIPLSGAPTVSQVITTERQVSHRPNIYGGNTIIHATALNSSFSVLKKLRSKERGLRRRKTALPPTSENPLYHNGSENVLTIVTTPDTRSALNGPATTAAFSTPAVKLETHSELRLFTTPATAISRKRHRQTVRRQRKPKKKAVPVALSDGVSIFEQPDHTVMTFTTTSSKVSTAEELILQASEKPCMTPSAAHTMSPIQLSLEKAKAQFSRKKRRKAALSIRQQ